jgi:hypothetical protein
MQYLPHALTINYLNGKDETWISDGVLHPETTLCANAGQVDIFLQQEKKHLKNFINIIISKDDI